MTEFKSLMVNVRNSADVYIEWFRKTDLSGVGHICDDLWGVMSRRAKEPMEDLLGYEYKDHSPVDDFLSFLLMTTVDEALKMVVQQLSEETTDKELVKRMASRLGVEPSDG